MSCEQCGPYSSLFFHEVQFYPKIFNLTRSSWILLIKQALGTIFFCWLLVFYLKRWNSIKLLTVSKGSPKNGITKESCQWTQSIHRTSIKMFIPYNSNILRETLIWMYCGFSSTSTTFFQYLEDFLKNCILIKEKALLCSWNPLCLIPCFYNY